MSQKAKLSHFARKGEDTSDVPLKKSVDFSGLEHSLDKAKHGLSEKISNVKSKTGNVQSGFMTFAKKHLFLVIVLSIVLPILIIIGINIPSQILRSKAFSLYESQNYTDSLTEFRTYLHDNPTDAEAALYAARAAMQLGEYDYASDALESIVGISGFSETDEFRFNRALAITPNEKSIDILTRLISASPEHSGGRLLRGVLLTRQDKTSLAREDFLQADTIIRTSQDFDNTDILAVHKRIINSTPPILPIFDLSPPIGDNSAVQNMAYRLNIPPVYADIYINRYIPVLPSTPLASDIGDDAIVSMYYTLLLLQAKELSEAGVEISKLPETLLSDSLTGSLPAILHAMRGNYAQAVQMFQPLAAQHPNNPHILFNLANATYFADPTPTGAIAALALLDKVVSLDNALTAAYHNRAFLRLLIGDDTGAQKDINAIADATKSSQTKTLQALVVLLQNPTDEKITMLLDGSHPYIQAAHHFALNKYDQALRWLWPSTDKFAGQLYAERLADFGLLLRARNILTPLADNIATNYEIARIDLAVGDVVAAEEILAQITQQSETDAYGLALNAFILHRKNKKQDAFVAITEAIAAATSPRISRQLAADAMPLFVDTQNMTILLNLLSAAPSLSPTETAILFHLSAPADAKLKAAAKAALVRYPVFDVQFHVGMGMLKSGNPDEALPILQNAANWQPTNIPLLSALQQLHTDLGDEATAAQIKQSIANIENQIINLDNPQNQESYSVITPKDPLFKQKIIAALKKEIDPKTVLDKFKTLLAKAKTPAEKGMVHLQRGSFFLLQQKYDLSIGDLQIALRTQELSENDKFRAAAYLGKALSLEKNYEEAAQVYQTASQQVPNLPLYRRLAGEALGRAGNLEESATYMEETISLFPADIQSYISLAQIYSQKSDPAKSVSILRKAVRAAPLYAPIYSVLSKTQAINNNTDAAKENSNIVSILTLTERT